MESLSLLIYEITQAFSDVPKPDPLGNNIDWDLRDFKEVPDRSTITAEFIRSNVFNLPLLSGEFVSYYLGEFLIYALNHLDSASDCTAEFTVGFLNAKSKNKAYLDSLFGILSEKQRQSIVKSLIYIRNKFPHQPIADECEQALSWYWQNPNG